MKKFLLAPIFLLASCAPPPDVEYNEQYHMNYGYRLEVVELEDGSRCAIYSAGGIDCDWK